MRRKYIEERWSTLMEFGQAADGRVGVTDERDTLDVLLAPEEAAKVIAHYNRLHEAFVQLAREFDRVAPDAFSHYWYVTCDPPGSPRATDPDQPAANCACE